MLKGSMIDTVVSMTIKLVFLAGAKCGFRPGSVSNWPKSRAAANIFAADRRQVGQAWAGCGFGGMRRINRADDAGGVGERLPYLEAE
jgi:hypothetical protein